MPGQRTKPRGDEDFRKLFSDHPQPMWIFDRKTLDFLLVNRAAVERYGYSAEEFTKMRLSDIRSPEVAGEVSDQAREGAEETPSVARSWHRLKNGRVVEADVLSRNLTWRGRPARLSVLLDVTQRQQLEEQLRQAQKMEAVGMLAGGIAHDFNNLLTIITGYSQLLLGNIPQTDSNRTAVEQIMKAGDRAAALTRQLLAFSRRQVLQPKILDLNVLVSGLAVMLRRLIGEDIDLRLVMGPELGRVSADPGQVEQVIMNLALNARDAMPQGGMLTIQTANTELEEGYGGTHLAVRPGAYVMLSVTDTGHGMDAETQSRIFEPFFTTKGQGQGTGLGLSTVFGIVKQSGGNLEVISEPGQGTSVKVYLPRIQQQAQVEAERAIPASARGSETILLVEDEDMVRSLVRETLERSGYKLLDAADPVEAMRICESYQGTIHLLITDVVLPKEGGRELASRLVALRPEMKVLFMSGYTDKALAAANDRSFLQKPFTPAVLARKVREVLEGNNGEKMRHAGN